MEQPRFKLPPVVETVHGVFFRTKADVGTVRLVEFWKQFSAEFPIVEERPLADEVREEFQDQLSPSVRWEVTSQLRPPRFWCSSSDKQHILQLQHNALLTNWLRPRDSAQYVGWDKRRAEFSDKLRALDDFLGGSVEVTSCLVTYINELPLADKSELVPSMAGLMEGWTVTTSDGWLPPPDNVRLIFSYEMPERAGRLNVEATPALRVDSPTPVLRLSLMARGQPKATKVSDAIDWIDLGHEWVVRGFASITRPDMHKKWERLE